METVLLAIFLIGTLYLISRVLAVYFRVRGEGVRHSEELLRAGVTFKSLLDGDVRNGGTGALLPAREGLTMISSTKGLTIRGTRTVARDVI